ncbi:hypothetical protein DXG03_008194 [Asterophora parasitica]|uniref:Alpha/beta-hydrolase n=1 Tax=Asterophora parasitica TaxID=117018 RepID=A0A9P7G852_9AGAR|nr:hypothetical protein DXG03_008194 [Asterophora parasitica]
MNSVYFPAHVVLVLRRIVNVISTLSISNHYLLPPRDDPKQPLAGDWDWPRLVRSNIQADPGSLPSRWSWPALLSTLTQVQPSIHPPDPPPPPHHNRRPPLNRVPPPEPKEPPLPPDTIHQLIQNPALYEPVRSPRYPIVLCHGPYCLLIQISTCSSHTQGLYGFDSRGPLKFPSMRMHYWSNVLNILRNKVGAEVIVTSVPGTGSIQQRAEILDAQLQHKAHGRGINFLAHSMGGLDCRHLITHIKPEVYAPLSLTSISTPHRGSPFMDWCAENIGIGKLRQQELHLARASPPPPPSPTTQPKPDSPFSLSLSSLPASFTTLLLSIVDSPAYANLTSHYLNTHFNPRTPNDPTVKYFSVAGRMAGVSIWHPFWLPKMVLDGVEERYRGRLRAVWEQQTGGVDNSESNPDPSEVPLWAQQREWGNDGLVTVQSAKWGEFLGIMEGCDHWEMRGARGIEFGVDLPAIPAIGLGVSTAGHRPSTSSTSGDGWGLPDWGRFVGAWKNSPSPPSPSTSTTTTATTTTTPRTREAAREALLAQDDAVIKASTDKLSAVFDWLTESTANANTNNADTNTPDTNSGGSGSRGDSEGERSTMRKRMDQEGKTRVMNELASKQDLERFYVALSRKLYDEGL